MEQFEILRQLGLVVLGATVCLLVARLVRVPAIMAYIVAGLVLGPVTGLLGSTESLEQFSELGIALLLFLVGLELSLDSIRGVGRSALVAGIGQVVFTAALGFGASLLLGFEPAAAALLALAVTFSSTVVVVKLLDQRGDLGRLYGRIAVGVLLVQDLVVVLALTLLAGLGTADGAAAAEAPVALPDDAGADRGAVESLVRAFAGMAVLGAVAFAAARWVLPRPFGWLARSLEAFFIWSLTWCFLFIIAAEALGLSVEIGAFIAGVSLAQLPYNHELRRRVQPLVNFFIAVFFVTLGIHMELGAASDYWLAAIVLSAIVLLAKPLALMTILPRLGYSERTSFLSSITLGQISEFSFIVGALGLAAGMLDDGVLSLIGVVGIVTIAVSSYLVTYNDRVYDRVARTGVLRWFGAETGPERSEPGPPRGHVVVVGLNALGRRLLRAFIERGEQVVVIDTDPSKLEGLPATIILGNATDEAVLAEANVAEAKLLVSALQIEDANALLAFRCHALGVPVSIHAFDPALIGDLEEIGVDHLIVSKHDGIRQVAAELRKAGVTA